MSEPRIWSLPPAPGPEVTDLRDCYGGRWYLGDDGGWWHETVTQPIRRGWGSLLADFGPLTEEPQP